MPTIAETFEQARRHHQAGEWPMAESLYRQILQLDPNHADALHLLGVLAHQTGNHQAAFALVRQAIAQNPFAEEYQYHLGIFHKDLGQLPEAIECFRITLRVNPNHREARNHLGIALFGQGKHADAAECFRHLLRLFPNEADAHNNLGKVLKDQGEPGQAAACFRRALAINRNNADTHTNLGSALKDLGQLNEAIACYRTALHINPNHADAYYNMGNALAKQGNHAEACESFRQALRINPKNVNAQNNLGISLRELGRKTEAEAVYRQAVLTNPNHANAHYNLGNALIEKGELAAAAACFQQSLRIEPKQPIVLNNLGNALVEQGQITAGEECFQKAYDLDATQKVALWNRSIARLLQGDFAGGWPDYEYRWAQPGKMERPFQEPRWDGSPLEGKTILIHAEQGLGDTIQFMRYVRLVKECGGRVLVESQPPLVQLLKGAAGVDEVLIQGEPLPKFDVQIPLMSLGGLFKTTLDTIPCTIPYIHADATLQNQWRSEFAQMFSEPQATAPLNVGIVWQGNPTQADDRYRSVRLSQFAPLAAVPGMRLISLQVVNGREQLADAPFPIFDLGSKLDASSLHDLAAVLPNLDLVVTVCTSVAHLGGAMGVPVWVALKRVPFWAWQLDGENTPWYPSLRLFRQRQFGDWQGVFERIAVALRSYRGSANRG